MTEQERIERLKEKYGSRGVETALRLQPSNFPELLEWRDELDPHYAGLWFDHVYGGMFTRGVVDDRTRFLVATGQCVVLDDPEELEHQIRGGLANGVPSREILEVILQATVYVGYLKVTKAARMFKRIMSELGRMDEITSTQLPMDGRDSERTLEQDRPTWRVSAEHFPRRDELMEKYGWRGIGAGIRLQPHHHIRRVEQLDSWDPHYLKLWLDYIYAGMYTRGVLDDKTRVLVMVGECVAVDEMVQADNHMRGALMLGATPREVLEVLLQSTVYVGMPRPIKALEILERILVQQGRVSELTETQLPLPV